jgi:phospholipid-translocating ATPase
MAISTNVEPDDAPNPTKRLRWATQRLTGKNGSKKRGSILGRLHHRGSQGSEKKRDSAGGESLGTDLGGITEEPEDFAHLDVSEAGSPENDGDGQGPRKIYFNQPLPPEAVDEEGHPLKHYRRNKIRTAKYTPISFVPKNIWYQFHNIANVYFLFLIILAVSHLHDLRNAFTNEGRSFSAFSVHQILD